MPILTLLDFPFTYRYRITKDWIRSNYWLGLSFDVRIIWTKTNCAIGHKNVIFPLFQFYVRIKKKFWTDLSINILYRNNERNVYGHYLFIFYIAKRPLIASRPMPLKRKKKNSHIIKNWQILEFFFFFLSNIRSWFPPSVREKMTIIFNGMKSINSIVYPINIKFQLKTGWKWLFVTGIPVLVYTHKKL